MLGWELGCRLGCDVGDNNAIVGIIENTEYKNNLNKECSLLSEIESNRLLQAIEENKERSE